MYQLSAAVTLFLITTHCFGQIISPSGCKQDAVKNGLYGAECGSITIPENPAEPDSRSIEIYITRIPSIRDTDNAPIFFIAGGPGQASTELAVNFRFQFSDLLIDHDFVFVDQRGTGSSNALDCDLDFFALAHLPLDAVEKISLETQASCLKNYQANLTHYSTPYAVNDLEKVRKLLGYQSLFMWGGSYGSRVVIEYLRRHPDILAGAILDGVAPVAIQLPKYSERDAGQALERTLQRCAAEASCNNAFPELTESWKRLLESLRQAPHKVRLKHPRTEVSVDVYVDDIVVSTWVRATLYSREVAPLLPLAMHSATQGDFAKLFSIFTLGFEDISEGISEGMQAAILCAEDRQFPVAENQINNPDTNLLRLPVSDTYSRSCSMYPKGDVPEDYFTPVESDVPVLLLSGEFDPVTPPVWGDFVAKGLSRSRHIVVPGGHHFVSALGCMPKVIFEFIDSPQALNDLDTECVNNIKPALFFIDNAGPGLSSMEMSDNEESL